MDNEEKMKILKAVANENRFFILRHLHKNKEMSVGDLAEAANTAFRSISRDLHFLRKANLVKYRNHFSERLYSLNLKSFSKELLSLLF